MIISISYILNMFFSLCIKLVLFIPCSILEHDEFFALIEFVYSEILIKKIHYTRSKLTARSIPSLNWSERFIIFFSSCISVAASCLFWSLGKIWIFFTNWIPSSNFAYSGTIKPRPTAEYIGIKFSVPPIVNYFLLL